MPRKIQSAAVIGSGIMGGGIAALLAGAGIKTLLLDIVPPNLKAEEKKDPLARNRIVKAGLDAALTIQPALFMSPRDAETKPEWTPLPVRRRERLRGCVVKERTPLRGAQLRRGVGGGWVECSTERVTERLVSLGKRGLSVERGDVVVRRRCAVHRPAALVGYRDE